MRGSDTPLMIFRKPDPQAIRKIVGRNGKEKWTGERAVGQNGAVAKLIADVLPECRGVIYTLGGRMCRNFLVQQVIQRSAVPDPRSKLRIVVVDLKGVLNGIRACLQIGRVNSCSAGGLQ